MTDIDNTKPRLPLKSETLLYQGKILKRTGTNPTNNEVWKLYQLLFKYGTSEYPRKFTAFETIVKNSPLHPKDLVEGNYYEILFVEEPYINQFGNQLNKKVIFLKQGNPANETQYIPKPRLVQQSDDSMSFPVMDESPVPVQTQGTVSNLSQKPVLNLTMPSDEMSLKLPLIIDEMCRPNVADIIKKYANDYRAWCGLIERQDKMSGFTARDEEYKRKWYDTFGIKWYESSR